MRARSTSPTRIASRSLGASATTAPKGSARNDEPQNSMPSPSPPGGRPWPTRSTAPPSPGLNPGGVVWVGPGGGAPKRGGNTAAAPLLRHVPQRLGARPRNRLGQVEQRGVLVLREVLRREQPREEDEPSPRRGG